MRRANIIRPVKLTTSLPEDVRTKLDLYLWSEVEQRIPVGAYQNFLLERIREFFDSATCDISKWVTVTGNPIVRGDKAAIDTVRDAVHYYGANHD